jgi:hypothetical protein
MSFREGWFPSLVASALLLVPAVSGARPQYAAREGMYCVSCHLDPAGGGMRHGNGYAYARGRHAWEVEPKFEEWKVDPEITKGVRIGGDVRYTGMTYAIKAHYDEETVGEVPRTFANYAMQGSFYVALNPVEPLFLYYNHDLGANVQKQRDWWGMIRNLTPLNIYIKMGQIRPPYGVRLEDHTPFVRGFEQPVPGETGIMDVDPRFTYPGVEVGLVKDGVFAHAAYADLGGTSAPNFTKIKEKLVSAKAGIQKGHLQVGGSFRANGLADGDTETKAHRYGAFALYGQKTFAVVAEADAGNDKSDVSLEQKVRAGYLEGEYYVSRGVTVRAELNYMDFREDQGDDMAVLSASRRFGAGLEWNPIPFLRLAAEGRYVSNSTFDQDPATFDETWGLGYAVFSF